MGLQNWYLRFWKFWQFLKIFKIFNIFFFLFQNFPLKINIFKKTDNMLEGNGGWIYVVRSRSFETFLGERFLFYLGTCHCTVSVLCLFQVHRPNFKSLGWRVNLLRHLKHDMFHTTCHSWLFMPRSRDVKATGKLAMKACANWYEEENSSCAFQNKVFFSLL